MHGSAEREQESDPGGAGAGCGRRLVAGGDSWNQQPQGGYDGSQWNKCPWAPPRPRVPVGYKVRCEKCGYVGNIYGPPIDKPIDHYNCGGMLKVIEALYQ